MERMWHFRRNIEAKRDVTDDVKRKTSLQESPGPKLAALALGYIAVAMDTEPTHR